jgi:hypothetical protein
VKKTIIALGAFCVGLAAIPLLTLAQTPATQTAMMQAPPTAPTFMCRNAAATEKPTGTIGTQSVVCKSSQAAMVGTMMKVPKTTGLDGPATDQAWRQWLYQVLDVRAGDG